MAKKVSNVALVLLMLATACGMPPDDSANRAEEEDGCRGTQSQPCPSNYCFCWDRRDLCRCPTSCSCSPRHGR